MNAKTLARWRRRVTYQEDGTHLIVHRHDRRAGIHWEVLQAVKTEAWGHDAIAVEIYPAESDIVNEKNARHLFRVPEDVHVPNLKRNRTWDRRFN